MIKSFGTAKLWLVLLIRKTIESYIFFNITDLNSNNTAVYKILKYR